MDRKEGKRNWYLRNRARILAESKIYRASRRDHNREVKRLYREKNKLREQERKKNWYEKNRVEITKRRAAYFQLNKAAIVLHNKAYQKERPLMRRKHELKYNYGLTPEVYSQMLQEQNNGCKICGLVFALEYKGVKKDRPHVDHDHASNLIRGILCHSCNLALGFVKDNVDLLKKMMDYLKEGGVSRLG